MATQGGVGISHARNPLAAGREAAQRALADAQIDVPDFVWMFASIGYPQEVLVKAVRESTGHAPLAGCSGEGVIACGEGDESNFSVAVMVVKSDELTFTAELRTGLADDAAQVGKQVAEAFTPAQLASAKAMFVLADGIVFNWNRFYDGLQAGLKRDAFLPLFGGTAGDNWQLNNTYQYCNAQVATDGVVAILLHGDVRIASAVNHGCVPIGRERTITRCNGNLIYEIDNKPVLEVLKEYLQDEEIEKWEVAIVNLCVGFQAPSSMHTDYDEFLIRYMPAKDEQQGWIRIPTEVTDGTKVWMTRRDQQKIANGIGSIVASIREQLGDNQPKLVFQFDCAGRGALVFRQERVESLLAELRDGIGPNAPWLGFYTFGEIGPVSRQNYFHNYTAVLTALY